MLEDTFESMEDGEEMEEAAEEEIDKILFELTAGEVISLTHSLYCCLVCNHLNLNRNETLANLAEVFVLTVGFATSGALGKAPSKVTDALPEMEPQGATAASDEESEEDIEAMQSRLEALRS